MKKVIAFLFAVVLVSGLSWGIGSAQLIVDEHHYLLYHVPPMHVWDGQIALYDQFWEDIGEAHIDHADLEFVGNPVVKNGEEDPLPVWHQTWWRIWDPQPEEFRVDIENQFGPARWYLKDAVYLVLPAVKFHSDPPGPPYEVPQRNHYKCYEVTYVVDADGEIVPPYPLNRQVGLADQWNDFLTNVMEPWLFCNPCRKEHLDGTGGDYWVVDPEPHLAVYWIDRHEPGQLSWWVDQFHDDPAFPRELWPELSELLVVPTIKLTWVGTEENTWGGVKNLYRD